MSYIVGLTGQSGAGKTTVSEVFSQNGFAVINADLVARELQQPETDCTKILKQNFPDCYNGNILIRQNLAQKVFNNKQSLELLNNIMYPFILDSIDKEIKRLNNNYILLDAPTLFESGCDKYCDCIVGVVCEKQTLINRIVQRDNISKELAEARLKNQKSIEFFKNNCKYIINNNRDTDYLCNAVLSVIQLIKEQQ